MKNWFTIEKIDDDTFAISEYQHWEETHCYLLCGTSQALLIDTGLGISSIREITDHLTSLPVTAVATHVHWDHIGGLDAFKRFAVHKAEKEWVADHFPIPLSVIKQNLLRQPCTFPEDFRLENYQIFQGEPSFLLQDGDYLSLGNRTLSVLHTPGHSPGHCCFYEPARQYLYSGDLIYSGCLDAFYPSTDPLQFWQSVRKVQFLPIRRILPGHHTLRLSPDILQEIEAAFHSLSEQGKLKQGNGVFPFRGFSIHI